MTRAEAIARAERWLSSERAPHAWRETLSALLEIARTIDASQAKRLASTDAATRRRRAAAGGTASWSGVSAEDRSAEMRRRAARRVKEK